MEYKWHTLQLEKIFEILKSGEHGLTSDEARRRLKQGGPNVLPEAKVDHILVIFLRQFESPLIYILLIAALIVFYMGEEVDSIVIMAVLAINAFIGAIQEGRARNTLLALKKFVETKAVVLRDGKEVIITDTEVVTGDIILLQEGDKVAADARLISVSGLKIDESALTGESEAVNKTSGRLDNPLLEILDQRNMVFKGTHVVLGSGQAVIVRTGVKTVIGKIAKEVSTIDTEIPLKADIRNLSRIIIIFALGISAFLFIFGVLVGQETTRMFATAVSILVSVIPEGLPIAITMILATGVWRMSKRNALVKRLAAVEALGQAEVILVDKTGTLTRNEMIVQTIYANGKTFEIGGVGYEPEGEVKLDNRIIDPPNHPELLLVAKLATFGANARLMFQEKNKEWKIVGDPTDGALLVLGEKLGFNKNDLERESPLQSEIPLNYNLKYHATSHKDNGKNFVTVIGAPEVILEASSRIWRPDAEEKLTEEDKNELMSIFSSLSKRGLRVLAAAFDSHAPRDLAGDKIKDLTFAGFFGLKDALRLEAKESTRQAVLAGIKVVMVTGDHIDTAETIAKEVGIYKSGDMSLAGRDIDKLSDKDLEKKLEAVSVFARVTPEHKLRIVKAYKSRGEIVAMTGDGVNDAPSLVAADLGVSMGRIGTEVAKEASDIVLLDDNFSSIISAIEEGRNIYKTIQKVVLYLLSTSIGELLVLIGAMLAGLPLPLLPAQIIWLNFVTDGFFTVALAMEPREQGLLSGRFHKPGRYIVDFLMSKRMLNMAMPMMVVTLFLFQTYLETDLAKALTVSLTLLAVFQWFNAWNCRSEDRSIFLSNPLENKSIVVATFVALAFQLLAVYHPLFQKFLHTVPLALSDWLVIIALATSIILVEEARKFLWRNKKSWSSSAPQLQANLT